MKHQRICDSRLKGEFVPGFSPEIDALAAQNLSGGGISGDGFFRAAWFRATSGDAPGTLILRDDGVPVAAIPTCLVGPALVGARKVPGMYWPHRGVLLAGTLDAARLSVLLKGRTARALGQVWRLGPMRGDDPAVALMREAGAMAGWQVLARPAGSAFVIDLAAAAAAGWPRGSTAKRLRRYDRNLAAQGTVSWRHVRGADWDEGVLAALGDIEAASWIASETDGSDAKFLHPHQRRQWACVLADPALAQMLCATILLLDDRPIAFCLDLDNGPRQYGIAGSYDREFAPFHVGKMVNYRVMADAIADGQTLLDLGSGDSGYKREMGAVAAYELVDLLFVRNPVLARVFGKVWGDKGAGISDDAARPGSAGHAGRADVWKHLAKAAGALGASAALAAAAMMLDS